MFRKKKGEDPLLETKEGGEQTQDISGKHRVVCEKGFDCEN